MAERIRDYARDLEAEAKERRERLKRTEDRIRGLVEGGVIRIGKSAEATFQASGAYFPLAVA